MRCTCRSSPTTSCSTCATPKPIEPIAAHYLSLTPFRRLIRDYFRIRDSYYDAIKTASSMQIETVDMARRGLHNEAAELLRTRLDNKLDMDLNTARRLFTLICAVQPYASRIDERESTLPSVLFVCSMNSVRSPIAAALARKLFPGRVIARSAGVRSGKADGFVHEVMEEIGIDMSVHTPHTMDELVANRFDLVVTLSPDAPEAVERSGLEMGALEHWPMPDPSQVEGNREAVLSAYRTLRDQLQQKVRERLEPLVAAGGAACRGALAASPPSQRRDAPCGPWLCYLSHEGGGKKGQGRRRCAHPLCGEG